MEEKARELLESNRDKLDALAEGLLENETLSSEEIDEILGSKKEEAEQEPEERKKAAN
jgi:ATP-dependent Zn protease